MSMVPSGRVWDHMNSLSPTQMTAMPAADTQKHERVAVGFHPNEHRERHDVEDDRHGDHGWHKR
jgi:hypothetical protein